ncbi:Agamous-like MADS-box protein AGL62 [Glycine soja]|uniref:Agamous-like MADS-box protein AGL62 n=1 Tax=Glycine soja TaxID=3848 RepID=A0A0B2RU35_GLYSO|nr:Agamous-like MADS-box protein AGL62 [Glycine soja]
MDSKSVPSLKGRIKKTKGQQKIEMKKVNNERYLQVTFSKRRIEIFKKASELAPLYSVDLAVILFSPCSRFFSFGGSSYSNVNSTLTMHRPPLMQNYVGVIDGSILCHRQFNNIHINGHGDGPTLGLF